MRLSIRVKPLLNIGESNINPSSLEPLTSLAETDALSSSRQCMLTTGKRRSLPGGYFHPLYASDPPSLPASPSLLEKGEKNKFFPGNCAPAAVKDAVQKQASSVPTRFEAPGNTVKLFHSLRRKSIYSGGNLLSVPETGRNLQHPSFQLSHEAAAYVTLRRPTKPSKPQPQQRQPVLRPTEKSRRNSIAVTQPSFTVLPKMVDFTSTSSASKARVKSSYCKGRPSVFTTLAVFGVSDNIA